jgi:hypothetical protein
MNEQLMVNGLTGQEYDPPALFKAPPPEAQGDQQTMDVADVLLPMGIQEGALLSAPLMNDPVAIEATRFIDFVLNDAHERYREPLTELYIEWQEENERYYQGRLQVPHILIAETPPQALVVFQSLTYYGGRNQIAIDARVLDKRRSFVIEAWPAEGNTRFVKDLLRHGMVHQALSEIERYPDEENIKHGEGYTEICNPIGRAMGLPTVVTRHRQREDKGKPKANAWPFNVRPEGYYLGHVIPPGQPRAQRPPALRGLAGVLSLFRHFLDKGQPDKLAAIVRREAGQTHEQICTAKAASEKGEVNRFNPAWLDWNDGCVKQLLHAIDKRKMVDLMPLLADALEAAGCGDELLLMHCRQPVRHAHNCWVLEALRRG